jgi:hypothetical protein
VRVGKIAKAPIEVSIPAKKELQLHVEIKRGMGA